MNSNSNISLKINSIYNFCAIHAQSYIGVSEFCDVLMTELTTKGFLLFHNNTQPRTSANVTKKK